MKLRNLTFIALAVLGSGSSVRAQNTQATQPALASDVEEIYVARSLRESTTSPTEFCAKARTGIADPTSESQFTFRSIATRASDGRVLDTDVKAIGSVHICLGRTANPAIIDFYGDILLGSTAFKGLGECHSKNDFPEKGLTIQRCFLELSGLPAEYVGGRLTTNTLNSLAKLIGDTEPPGYTQSSIATIRLWRKRGER